MPEIPDDYEGLRRLFIETDRRFNESERKLTMTTAEREGLKKALADRNRMLKLTWSAGFFTAMLMNPAICNGMPTDDVAMQLRKYAIIFADDLLMDLHKLLETPK